MAVQLAFWANLAISMAYFGITVAIVVPVTRAGQLWSNRLATATAMIFFSCAVGHGLHSIHALDSLAGGGQEMTGGWPEWPSAAWDALTATVGVYYWTLRRNYRVLLEGGALFTGPLEQQRLYEIELRERVAESRAAAEAERDAQARMLAAVIGNSQSLIYIKDVNGRFLLVNDAFEKAFGVSAAELIGQTDEHLAPEQALAWRANDLLARDGPYRAEERAPGPDGERIYETVKFPLYAAGGEFYAICGVSLDITALRQAMAEAERARDEAVAQSAIKSRFLATMSHEIRTPMNGVIGLADLLRTTELDSDQRRYADGIHSAGTALLSVINDLLDFSKIEAGMLVLDEEDYQLPAVLDGVASLVTPTAEAKGLTIFVQKGPDLPRGVRGDAGRLRQILLNLASNAVKFTAQGSVTLRADLLPEPSGPLIRFEVIDTGIGVDPAGAERLFEPFTQADSSTTRTYGGTGLGLAICRQLAEAMGGRIGLDSEPGQGSTFWYTMPFRPAVGVPSGGVVAPCAFDTGGLRVLVVDTGAEGMLLQERLRRWRMESVTAESAEDALVALREAARRGRAFDLVILDAELPGIEPVDLARRITSEPAAPGTHLVIVHRGVPVPEPTASAVGITCQLAKPIRQSRLFDCLAQAMAAPRRSPAAPRPPAASPAPGPATGAHVLLVEDNEINQMVAVGLLGRLGYSFDVAQDGIEAVDLATHRPYAAVLMDCQMPRMDGFAATRELRRLEGATGHLPIIAMTASAQVIDHERCLAAGMDDFVSKPVDPAEFEAVLARWTSGQARPAEIAGPAPGAADDPVGRRLADLRGDGTPNERALIVRLISSLLERAPGYLAALAEAVASGDARALETQAHSFRGVTANLGAAGPAEICQRLEALGRAGPLGPLAIATAADDLDRLRASWRVTVRRLQQAAADESAG